MTIISFKSANRLFLLQKPLDFCVQVHRVRREEASQALQNGPEEALARGRGEEERDNKPRPVTLRQSSAEIIPPDICRRSRRRRRMFREESSPSGRSPPVQVETPRGLSRPPDPRRTRPSPDPTGTTESRTTLASGTSAAMVPVD